MLGNALGKDAVGDCQRLASKRPDKVDDGLLLRERTIRVMSCGNVHVCCASFEDCVCVQNKIRRGRKQAES